MRTTLNLSDDARLAASTLAAQLSVSLGEAASILIRRGAAAGDAPDAPLAGRFSVVARRDGATLSSQTVYAILDEVEA